MDIGSLMQMANQLREQLANAQEKSAELRFEGEAAAGLVRVVMDGRYMIQELKIDPKAIDKEDLKLLEDLIRAAVNQAASRVGAGLQDHLGGLAQGLGVDLSGIFPTDLKPKP